MCTNDIKINSLDELVEMVKDTRELFDEALYTVILCDNNEILSNHTLKAKDELEQILKTYLNGSYLNYPVKITCKYISRQKFGRSLSKYGYKTRWNIKFENQSKKINNRGMNKKFKVLISVITIVLSAQIFTLPAFAGKPQKPVRLQEGDVKILASGTSTTENEAVTIALRSALEQAFGTFVSANTTLVNDALVKDEIVSITTGNIKHYDIINSTLLPNGNTTVLLNAIVSTNNLVKYAQNHGSSTELAGNKLALAMRLEQMNIESEWKTMQNLMEQLEAFLPNLFDYEIEVGDPNMKSTSTCVVPLKVIIKSNQNTLSFQKLLKNTLLSLPAATGKIGDVKCCKFVLFDQNKILNEDIWYDSLNRFFNTQIIPQLTAFDIVDQNNNILASVRITPVKHMIDWEECAFNVKFFGNNIPDYYRETDNGIYIEKSFRDEQYLRAMSVSSYKPVDFRLAYGTFLPGVYRYVNMQYGEVLDSGCKIFPFPEINEDILSSRKTKKSKKVDSAPTSKSLFCIDWILLTFNTVELNRISEIRIVPSRVETIPWRHHDRKNLSELLPHYVEIKSATLSGDTSK